MGQSTNPLSRTSYTGPAGATDAVTTTSSPPPPSDAEALGARVRESAGEITAQAKESALGAVDDAIVGVKDQASTLLGQASEALGNARAAAHEALGGARAATREAAGDTHATVGGTRYGLVETIKVNPLPAVLVGLGLGWLFRQSRGTVRRDSLDWRAHEAVYREHRSASPAPTSAYGAYAGSGNPSVGRNPIGAPTDRIQTAAGNVASRAGDLAGRAGDAVGDAAGQVGETTGDLLGQVGETASGIVGQIGDTAGNIASGTAAAAGNLAEQAQYRAMRLEDSFQRVLRTNPLAVGAVTLALGTAIGLALPQTQRENQLMGEARDTVLERAQALAQETVEKVQHVATEAQETVTETVKEEAKSQGLTR